MNRQGQRPAGGHTCQSAVSPIGYVVRIAGGQLIDRQDNGQAGKYIIRLTGEPADKL